MKVDELVDRDLTALTEDCTVSDAIEVLFRHKVSGLPVVDDDNRVVGFISEKDIVDAALPGYAKMLHDSSFLPDYGQFSDRLKAISCKTIDLYMRREVITFDEDDSDFYVANKIIKDNIKMAPVLRDGLFIGVITRAHLLKHLLEE